MGTSFRPYEPDKFLLFSPEILDGLPQDHMVHKVGLIVDWLDLSAFYLPYEGGGRRNTPYHPAMMVKVLIYGYATGVCSSRKLARGLKEDLAFRVLAADNTPAHRTICGFRQRHLEDLKRVFAETVHLANELGLEGFDGLTIDSTKVPPEA
ncbi:MAG: transposase [Rhodobacteraceae bacterium]|nr:transposase [Paracoccaceae bacterium]